jgi:hypothetical protein
MSMDLSVWCPATPSLPAVLPSGEWVQTGSEFALEGDGWHVLALLGTEAPPQEVLERLPSATSVVYITLEPIGAPDEAYARLESVVRHVARVTGGVWVDPNGEAYSHNEG